MQRVGSRSLHGSSTCIVCVAALASAAACVVRGANRGHHLADGRSSWCPKLESRTTHRLPRRPPREHLLLEPGHLSSRFSLEAMGSRAEPSGTVRTRRCEERRSHHSARRGGGPCHGQAVRTGPDARVRPTSTKNSRALLLAGPRRSRHRRRLLADQALARGGQPDLDSQLLRLHHRKQRHQSLAETQRKRKERQRLSLTCNGSGSAREGSVHPSPAPPLSGPRPPRRRRTRDRPRPGCAAAVRTWRAKVSIVQGPGVQEAHGKPKSASSKVQESRGLQGREPVLRLIFCDRKALMMPDANAGRGLAGGSAATARAVFSGKVK